MEGGIHGIEEIKNPTKKKTVCSRCMNRMTAQGKQWRCTECTEQEINIFGRVVPLGNILGSPM